MRKRSRPAKQATRCAYHDRPLINGRCDWDIEVEKKLMPTAFQKGDRVRFLSENDGQYRCGLVGSVLSVKPHLSGGDDIDFRADDGTRFTGCAHEFEHVDEVPVKPNPGVTLNPSDPFEAVIIDMVATNRRKRADYAVDGSPWSNFDDTANALGIDGFSPVDAANFNIEQKSARLRSLRKNNRMDDPENESVADTYLDRAVYSVIALAMHKYPTGKVPGDE